MASAKISADGALDLAKQFRMSATLVGDYCYNNWNALKPNDRDQLRSLEVTLLNLATDLITQSVGIILDDANASLRDLVDATKVAQKALAKIADARKAINLVTALIGLAAAIPTGNPMSILSAVKALQDAGQGKSTNKQG